MQRKKDEVQRGASEREEGGDWNKKTAWLPVKLASHLRFLISGPSSYLLGLLLLDELIAAVLREELGGLCGVKRKGESCIGRQSRERTLGSEGTREMEGAGHRPAAARDGGDGDREVPLSRSSSNPHSQRASFRSLLTSSRQAGRVLEVFAHSGAVVVAHAGQTEEGLKGM